MDANEFCSSLSRQNRQCHTAGQPFVHLAVKQVTDHGFARKSGKNRKALCFQQRQVSQQLKVVLQGFSEAETRVENDLLSSDTNLFARAHALLKKIDDFLRHVLVLRVLLHGGRLALHVHKAHREPAIGCCLQRTWAQQCTNIIDDARSRLGGCRHDLG